MRARNFEVPTERIFNKRQTSFYSVTKVRNLLCVWMTFDSRALMFKTARSC